MLRTAALVLAVALLGCAAILLASGLRDLRLFRTLRRLDMRTPDELVRLARAGELRNELVAVTGVAQPGPDGLLSSTVNEVPSVWHRHTIHRRRVRRLSDGRTRTMPLRRRVANETTSDAVTLTGTAARVELRPEGLYIHRPARTSKRVLPGIVSQPFPDADGLMANDQYAHREWVIRAGTPLVVLGQATLTATGLVVRKPPSGPHIVSTRSARGLRLYHITSAVLAFLFAVAAIVAAIVLLVGA